MPMLVTSATLTRAQTSIVIESLNLSKERTILLDAELLASMMERMLDDQLCLTKIPKNPLRRSKLYVDRRRHTKRGGRCIVGHECHPLQVIPRLKMSPTIPLSISIDSKI